MAIVGTIYTIGKKKRHRQGVPLETKLDAFRVREHLIGKGLLDRHTKVWAWTVDSDGHMTDPREEPELEHIPSLPEILIPEQPTRYVDAPAAPSPLVEAFNKAFVHPDVATVAGVLRGMLERELFTEKKLQAAEASLADMRTSRDLWRERALSAEGKLRAVTAAQEAAEKRAEPIEPARVDDRQREILALWEEANELQRRVEELMSPPSFKVVTPPAPLPLLDHALNRVAHALNSEA